MLKLAECLEVADDSLVRRIAKKLGGIPVEPDFKKGYLIYKITGKLLDRVNLRKAVLSKIDAEYVEGLKRYVLAGTIPHRRVISELSTFGIFFHGVMPEDLQATLKDELLSQVLRRFPGLSEPYTPSAFLKTILLAGMIMRVPRFITVNKKRTKNNISKILLLDPHDRMIPMIIEYLEYRGLAQWREKEFHPNNKHLRVWLTSEINLNLQDFYSWVTQTLRMPAITEMFDKLGEIQTHPEDWVDAEIFSGVMTGGAAKNIPLELGLIRFQQEQDADYIQLTPEGWHLAKAEYPPTWGKEMIVSADFELFIPHTYDPLIIAVVDSFCELKSNDFFLVYDMNSFKPSQSWLVDFQTFIKLLKSRCQYLPDVVRYFLEVTCAFSSDSCT